jgi:hypothetical protein
LKNQILKNKTLKLGLETLESRKLCAIDLAVECHAVEFHAADISAFTRVSPVGYYNIAKPADVDGDGRVSPIDALRVIDALNRVGTSRPVSGAEGEQEPVGNVDTNNDGSLNPIDVLVVIDALNAYENFEPMAFESFKATAFEATAFEEVEVTAFEEVEVTAFEEDDAKAYETDVVFEEIGTEFDFGWIKRGGISEEFPMFVDEEFALVDVEYNSEDSEIYPVYAMVGYGPTSAANAAGAANVAVFSKNGPMGQVMRRNLSDNADIEPAVVSYFSSNFLRGSGR